MKAIDIDGFTVGNGERIAPKHEATQPRYAFTSCAQDYGDHSLLLLLSAEPVASGHSPICEGRLLSPGPLRGLSADMARLGIERDEEHCFGRPYILGFSVPVFAIAERFTAGESVEALHADYPALGTEEVENAIRFAMLYPKSDLPSFWKNV